MIRDTMNYLLFTKQDNTRHNTFTLNGNPCNKDRSIVPSTIHNIKKTYRSLSS